MIALGSRIGGVWRIVLRDGSIGYGNTITAALSACGR